MPVPNRSGLKIVNIDVKDVRFPTSLGCHGSDAVVSKFKFLLHVSCGVRDKIKE
jgi:hypothetical protein